MKKIVVSSLALLAIAASTMVASSASSAGSVGATYDESITWPTGPTLISVDNGFPLLSLSTTTNIDIEAEVSTDGSGKIEGVAYVRILHGGGSTNVTEEIVTNSDNTTTTNFTTNVATGTGFSDFIVDVTGKITSKKAATAVTLTLKGSGYSSSNTAPDFFTVEANAKPATLSLTFNGTGGAVSNDTITGTVKGSINPGLKGINNGKSLKISEDATLAVSSFGLSNLFLEIVQIGNKFSSADFVGEGGGGIFSGKGSSNNKGTFTSTHKGVGQAHGANFKLSGTTGPLNIAFGDVTNNVPNAPLSDIELKGKLIGQTVDVTGGTATLGEF
jgi:hypothetical protein